jgi:hypothetical protein
VKKLACCIYNFYFFLRHQLHTKGDLGKKQIHVFLQKQFAKLLEKAKEVPKSLARKIEQTICDARTFMFRPDANVGDFKRQLMLKGWLKTLWRMGTTCFEYVYVGLRDQTLRLADPDDPEQTIESPTVIPRGAKRVEDFIERAELFKKAKQDLTNRKLKEQEQGLLLTGRYKGSLVDSLDARRYAVELFGWHCHAVHKLEKAESALPEEKREQSRTWSSKKDKIYLACQWSDMEAGLLLDTCLYNGINFRALEFRENQCGWYFQQALQRYLVHSLAPAEALGLSRNRLSGEDIKSILRAFCVSGQYPAPRWDNEKNAWGEDVVPVQLAILSNPWMDDHRIDDFQNVKGVLICCCQRTNEQWRVEPKSSDLRLRDLGIGKPSRCDHDRCEYVERYTEPILDGKLKAVFHIPYRNFCNLERRTSNRREWWTPQTEPFDDKYDPEKGWGYETNEFWFGRWKKSTWYQKEADKKDDAKNSWSTDKNDWKKGTVPDESNKTSWNSDSKQDDGKDDSKKDSWQGWDKADWNKEGWDKNSWDSGWKDKSYSTKDSWGGGWKNDTQNAQASAGTGEKKPGDNKEDDQRWPSSQDKQGKAGATGNVDVDGKDNEIGDDDDDDKRSVVSSKAESSNAESWVSGAETWIDDLRGKGNSKRIAESDPETKRRKLGK